MLYGKLNVLVFQTDEIVKREDMLGSNEAIFYKSTVS